jgi:hypothetical protein
MITREITVHCDYEYPAGSTCGEQVQFNEDECRGLPSLALRCARDYGWQHTREGKDYCPGHKMAPGARAQELESLQEA